MLFARVPDAASSVSIARQNRFLSASGYRERVIASATARACRSAANRTRIADAGPPVPALLALAGNLV